MNFNGKKFDPNSKEGKRIIGIFIGAIVALALFGEFILIFIPFAIVGFIIYIGYKSTQSKDKNGFDYDKSYSKRKDVEPGLLETKRLEEEYLKGRNYSANKVNENKLFFDRKTTEFDKHHAHPNMYPTKPKTTLKNIKSTPLTKEEELHKTQQELKLLKKDYNEYRIGILEFREKETELKTKIKALKKDILEAQN